MAPENPFAFPFADVRDENGCGIREGSNGMTLRDYFAGQAIVEFASLISVSQPNTLNVVARLSYQMADALLAERAKAVRL